MLDIGVVTPTHPARIANGYTARAINSALEQDLMPSALCVYNDKGKRGAPFSRQQALMMNNEPWTAFLDSDDWFGPRHLKVLAQAQLETGADYVYSWYDLLIMGRNQGGRYTRNPDGTLTDGVFPPEHFTEPWDNDKPRQTTITTLVRTELAKEIGFWAPSDETEFEDGHRVGEDYNFTLGCMKAGGKIHHVVERTWVWSHHGLNTSGRPDQGDAQ